jgi:ABC-type glutathione transport system ATPase component
VEAVLRIESLGKAYGRPGESTWAARDVSFTVKRGETVAVVGESGAGKTTIGRCVLGLTEPSEGRIVLDDTDLLTLGRRERRERLAGVGAVFQDSSSSLNPRWPVERSVRHPLDVRHRGKREERRRRAHGALERVGLGPKHAQRAPWQLSGGERQRAAIARSLVLEPRLVVLDEPTSALDVSVQAQIIDLLVELQRDSGTAFVFVSHDLAVVRAVSDHVVVMKEGRVVEQGPVDVVLGAPANAYTRELLDAVPEPPEPDGQAQGGTR